MQVYLYLAMEQQSKAPQDIRNVVNFLRSSNAGIKVRVGVLNGKRIDYFKGAFHNHLFSFMHVMPDPAPARPRQGCRKGPHLARVR